MVKLIVSILRDQFETAGPIFLMVINPLPPEPQCSVDLIVICNFEGFAVILNAIYLKNII